ncbi:Transposase (or an inactivated derivative) [Nonomuraea wenchangensis]|uniref:Mutator family transposase n=1 Tax=Nonomuraea wenchangensis TaxID=568860 RepID=A0A1I0LLP6_9ACTN|nr:Transposase (or an inactivated derivative) [Nonomuraea wenchangensis]
MVRNGHYQPRTVLTSAGAIEVRAPRVDGKRIDAATGEHRRFSSSILPPWCRKSPAITEVLPLLYLHGLSTGDFMPALGLWADGIHVNIRLEEHKPCLLVLIGVRADGRKELVALTDGYQESAEPWADLLLACARRGMRGPVLAVGDGALGFWSALAEMFPQAKAQRCWFHKIANVLGALPKSAHSGAKKALAQIWNAESKDRALAAVAAFEAAYGAKFPKAVAKVTDDVDELLAFYDYPAEHWRHMRTSDSGGFGRPGPGASRHDRHSQPDRRPYGDHRRTPPAHLNGAAHAAHTDEGLRAAIQIPEAVTRIMGASRRTETLGTLTPREREVPAMMAEGRSRNAVAAALFLSYGAMKKDLHQARSVPLGQRPPPGTRRPAPPAGLTTPTVRPCADVGQSVDHVSGGAPAPDRGRGWGVRARPGPRCPAP